MKILDGLFVVSTLILIGTLTIVVVMTAYAMFFNDYSIDKYVFKILAIAILSGFISWLTKSLGEAYEGK